MFLKHTLKLMALDLADAWSQRRVRAQLRAQSVIVDRRAMLCLKGTNFAFEPGVTIGAFTCVVVAPDPLSENYDGGLFVGRNVYVGAWNNLRAAGGVIRIGDDTMVSQMVSIFASGHQTKPGIPMRLQPNERERSGVIIGKDVWLGAGSTILPGAEIGDGAIIAAGAVVHGVVPSNTIYGGVPARQIGVRE